MPLLPLVTDSKYGLGLFEIPFERVPGLDVRQV